MANIYNPKFETDEYKFIFGIKSEDDRSDEDANFDTDNDLELLYNKIADAYRVRIETIPFAKTQMEKEYVQNVFNQFTAWMNEYGYDTNYTFDLHEVFYGCLNCDICFETIEMAYACFKILALGYLAE